jgi:cysteinyl-tRNA synthetase
MKLYNTLTQRIEDLQPQKPSRVTFYSCGPTVYNYLQIGNWLAFIRWDMLARTLKASGYGVDWFMNITDVGHLVSDADEGEDKLEKGARREGKTAWEVASHYTDEFLEGLDALNISVDRSHLPKATDHIAEQIELVRKLEDQGFTYTIDDGVYFDTSKYKDYGKLGNIDLKKQKSGARVAVNTQKRLPYDFALWKFSPQGKKRDMEWDSPWGKGFPGWHLECSTMAMKYLGDTLDIHAGGIDHIPTHHNGEIAQSEAATGKPFAKLWLHSNFLTVDGTKLSKSLGNSYALTDLSERGFDPLDFRFFALQSHYRSEANFTWDGLKAAQNRLKSLRDMADMRFQLSEKGADCTDMLDEIRNKIMVSLQNDLHTPTALAVLSSLESHIQAKGINVSCGKLYSKFIRWIDNLFGLSLSTSDDISSTQKGLIYKRELARSNNEYKKSDDIRLRLRLQGISIRDTAYGTVWSRISD